MDINYIKRLYDLEKITDNYINNFKSKIYDLDDIYMTSLRYTNIAICEYLLNKDNVSFKENLYISAYLLKIMINKYDQNYNISPSFVKMNNFYFIIKGIISDNWNLTIDFAKIIGNRKNEEKGDSPFTYNYGYALKYIILDEYEKASHYIDKLKILKTKKVYKLYTGYINTLIGIYNNNINEIKNGLNEMIEQYQRKRDNKNTIDEYICLDVIGLAKLAIKKDLDIQFEHKLAPKELINFNEINYPEIEILKYID